MALDLGELALRLGVDVAELKRGLGTAEGTLKTWTGKAAKLGAAAGVAVGAGLSGALVKAINVDAANDKLAASLGLNEAQSERLGKVAGDLYADAYGDSMESVNTAVAAVRSSIKGLAEGSDEDLKKATATALDFATTFEVDVSRAAQVAGQTVRTGLAKDSTEAFDLLTKSMQGVPAALREDVLDAVDEYGPSLKSMGITGAEAFGLLVKGAEKGMYGIDKAGDAIKEFSIRATDGSEASMSVLDDLFGEKAWTFQDDLLKGGDAARNAMQEIVKALLSVEDPSDRANQAIALFGTPLEDLNVSEIPQFLESLVDSGTAMKDFSGSADRMGETLNDNAKTRITAFKRGIETAIVGAVGAAIPFLESAGASLRENFGPALADLLPQIQDVATQLWDRFGPAVVDVAKFIVDDLVPAVMAITGFIVEHETATAALIITMGALLTITKLHAAYLAVTAAGGLVKYIASIRLVTSVAKVWTATQWLLNAALLANPIGLVIAAIAGIVAFFVLAYKKSDTFRLGVEGLWLAMKAGFGWVKENWPLLLAIITGPFGLAVLAITKNWDKIKGGARATKQFIVDKFNDLVGFFTGMPDRITAAIKGAWSVLKESIRDILLWVKERLDEAMGPVDEAVILATRNPGGTTKSVGKAVGKVLLDKIGFGATGGIVTQPTLSVIGEAGPEAVVPLNRMPGASPLPSGQGGGGGGFPSSIVLRVDGESFLAYVEGVAGGVVEGFGSLGDTSSRMAY